MKGEAASGLEPESRGFADLRLNHLATPPRRSTIEDSRWAINKSGALAALLAGMGQSLPNTGTHDLPPEASCSCRKRGVVRGGGPGFRAATGAAHGSRGGLP